MRWTSILVIGLAAFLFGCEGNSSPDQLSDSDARQMFERAFNNNRWWVLLGDQTVVAGDTNTGSKTISTTEYDADKQLERAGLIWVGVRKDLVNGRFSWGSWLGLAQGARYLISVTPMASGKSESEKTKMAVRKPGFLYFQFVDISVGDIVENKDVKKSVDRFRVIKGTGTIHCTAIAKKVAEANRSEPTIPASERVWWNTFRFPCADQPIKFVTLLKFDPFGRKWKIVTSDLARSQEDFTNDSVTEYLSKS